MDGIDSFLKILAPGWVGSIIGIVSIIASVIIYFLSRNRAVLAFTDGGSSLLDLKEKELGEGIAVLFNGEPIARLTRSYFVFWNGGEKTFVNDDIVKLDPLRLTIDGQGTVLSAKVLKEVRPITKIRACVEPDNNDSVILSFLFLDPGDGAVIEVLHTGEAERLKVQGTVRGLPKGLQYKGRKPEVLSEKFIAGLFNPSYWGRWLITLGSLSALLLLFSPNLYGMPKDSPTQSRYLQLAVLQVLVGSVITYSGRRRFPRQFRANEIE